TIRDPLGPGVVAPAGDCFDVDGHYASSFGSLMNGTASRRDVRFFFIFVLSPYIDALLSLKMPEFTPLTDPT
ncbi:MAG TPA: hypothetical protein VLT59_17575, partial [Steroidobacteraceae bacterium]|nr:hypothetical protein [Steroidobacteraceae bacterium]